MVSFLPPLGPFVFKGLLLVSSNGNSFSLISIMIYFSKKLNLISLNHSSTLIKENESLNQKCKSSECERQAQVSYDFKERP